MDSAPTGAHPTEPRTTMYQLLEAPFVFPTFERTQSFLDGSWQKQLAASAARLKFELPEGSDQPLQGDSKAFEVESISLFEVGMGGAPCPLHSGHYARDRLSTMEEVLRFYRFFDFHPDRSADRFPDHINFELQFMAHLAEVHGAAVAAKGDVISPLLAQRDFITRNLVSWLPELADLTTKKTNIKFFKTASSVLSDFVVFDGKALAQLVSLTEAA